MDEIEYIDVSFDEVEESSPFFIQSITRERLEEEEIDDPGEVDDPDELVNDPDYVPPQDEGGDEGFLRTHAEEGVNLDAEEMSVVRGTRKRKKRKDVDSTTWKRLVNMKL